MELSNLTKRRIKSYLENGKRLDGRKFLDYRKIEIETGISKNAEGSAKAIIGEDEGTMVTTVELLPLSSADFEYGPPRIDAIEIARVVDRGIRESGFFDFKKLCIKKGEKVWTVFIDIYSINDDGNLLDASALAAVSALLSAKMTKYNEKEEMKITDLSPVSPNAFTFE